MELRDLGRTGVKISALGFGCGAGGGVMTRGRREDQRRVVRRAIEAGITYFDTAPAYGQGLSEENIGLVFKELQLWGKVVLGTKVRFGAVNRTQPASYIRHSVEMSLRRLGRDHIDLLQLHNPVCDEISALSPTGDDVPVAEVLAGIIDGMESLQKEGLVSHIGFTGLGNSQALHTIARDGRFSCIQAYFNVLNPSAGYAGVKGGAQDFGGLIDVCAHHSVGVLAFRVFASGALLASADRHPMAGQPDAPLDAGLTYEGNKAAAKAFLPLVREFGLESPLELALRFAQGKAGVSSVLVGFSDLDQLEAALRWSERGMLPEAAVTEIIRINNAYQSSSHSI